MDSRDNEDTFKLVKNTLTNVLSDDQLLDPSYATLGNKDNTYTDKAQIMNWLIGYLHLYRHRLLSLWIKFSWTDFTIALQNQRKNVVLFFVSN